MLSSLILFFPFPSQPFAGLFVYNFSLASRTHCFFGGRVVVIFSYPFFPFPFTTFCWSFCIQLQSCSINFSSNNISSLVAQLIYTLSMVFTDYVGAIPAWVKFPPFSLLICTIFYKNFSSNGKFFWKMLTIISFLLFLLSIINIACCTFEFFFLLTEGVPLE